MGTPVESCYQLGDQNNLISSACSAKAQSLAAALGVTKAIAVANMSLKLIESIIIVDA